MAKKRKAKVAKKVGKGRRKPARRAVKAKRRAPKKSARKAKPKPKPVVIESDVMIYMKSTILRGVRIGRGSVVGANSLVNRDVPPFTIVAGVPAKEVGRLDPAQFVCPDEPVDPAQYPAQPDSSEES